MSSKVIGGGSHRQVLILLRMQAVQFLFLHLLSRESQDGISWHGIHPPCAEPGLLGDAGPRFSAREDDHYAGTDGNHDTTAGRHD